MKPVPVMVDPSDPCFMVVSYRQGIVQVLRWRIDGDATSTLERAKAALDEGCFGAREKFAEGFLCAIEAVLKGTLKPKVAHDYDDLYAAITLAYTARHPDDEDI